MALDLGDPQFLAVHWWPLQETAEFVKSLVKEHGSPDMTRKGKAAELATGADDPEEYDPNAVIWETCKQAFTGQRRKQAAGGGGETAAAGQEAEGGPLPKGLGLYGLLEGNPETWAAAKAKLGKRKRGESAPSGSYNRGTGEGSQGTGDGSTNMSGATE